MRDTMMRFIKAAWRRVHRPPAPPPKTAESGAQPNDLTVTLRWVDYGDCWRLMLGRIELVQMSRHSGGDWYGGLLFCQADEERVFSRSTEAAVREIGEWHARRVLGDHQ